jgi:hypothetical protein
LVTTFHFYSTHSFFCVSNSAWRRGTLSIFPSRPTLVYSTPPVGFSVFPPRPDMYTVH